MVKKIMKLIVWLKNRKKYKKPKRINLSNIFNYLDAEVRHWKSTSKFLDNPRHIDEQSIWRLEQIKEKSPECIQHLHCIMCGCDIAEKSFEDNACDEGCYPKMMNEKEWEIFKQKNKIEIL